MDNQTNGLADLETRKLPAIAMTAITLAQRGFMAQQEAFSAQVQQMGREALDALGLDPADGWFVNFDTGQAEKRPPQGQEAQAA
jgi:hypothetical protein